MYNFQPPETLDVATMKLSWQDNRVERARYVVKRTPQHSLNGTSTGVTTSTIHVTTEQINSDRKVGTTKHKVINDMTSKTELGSRQKCFDNRNEENRTIGNHTETAQEGEPPPVVTALRKTEEQTSDTSNCGLRTPTGATLQTMHALGDDHSSGSAMAGGSGGNGRYAIQFMMVHGIFTCLFLFGLMKEH